MRIKTQIMYSLPQFPPLNKSRFCDHFTKVSSNANRDRFETTTTYFTVLKKTRECKLLNFEISQNKIAIK